MGGHHAHHIQALRHPVLHLCGGPAGVGPGHPGPDSGIRGGAGQVLRERVRAGLHLPLGPSELHPGRDHHGRHGAGDQHQPHLDRRVGAEQDARSQHQDDERAHLGADDLGRRAGAEDQWPAVQLHLQLHLLQAMTPLGEGRGKRRPFAEGGNISLTIRMQFCVLVTLCQ